MATPGVLLVSHTPHRIRLRRPWNCQVREGYACWTRRFGRPMDLSTDERVWLIVEGLPPETVTVLNGIPIPTGRFDITSLLHARNELTLKTPLQIGAITASSDESPALVVLEICPLDRRSPD